MRKKAIIIEYRALKQVKMEGGLSPKQAEKMANKWEAEGYETSIGAEEKHGDDAVPQAVTYLVEGEREVVEIDELTLQEALAGLQVDAVTHKAHRGKGKSKG